MDGAGIEPVHPESSVGQRRSHLQSDLTRSRLSPRFTDAEAASHTAGEGQRAGEPRPVGLSVGEGLVLLRTGAKAGRWATRTQGPVPPVGRSVFPWGVTGTNAPCGAPGAWTSESGRPSSCSGGHRRALRSILKAREWDPSGGNTPHGRQRVSAGVRPSGGMSPGREQDARIEAEPRTLDAEGRGRHRRSQCVRFRRQETSRSGTSSDSESAASAVAEAGGGCSRARGFRGVATVSGTRPCGSGRAL